ncbi:MAG: hypothetical protein WCD68_17655 [Candidatus Acidiferrum sp.]
MRKTFSLLGVIFVLAFAGVASADNLNYIVTGYGGLSPAVTQVSQNAFWWAASNTSSSTVSGSVLTTYGFDPLSGTSASGFTPAPYSENGLYTGSLLLSTPFTVNGAQGLTLTWGEVTAAGFDYGNFEFAVLLQNSQTVAILGLVAPVVPGSTSDEKEPGTILTPVSSGVQVTTQYYNSGYPGTFQLGSTEFGEATNNQNGYCNNSPCQGQFTSSYTPAAGSYQLIFGSFGNGNNFPAAVTVESVSVPESGNFLGYVVVGFLVILLLRRRTQFVKPQP